MEKVMRIFRSFAEAEAAEDEACEGEGEEAPPAAAKRKPPP